MLNCKIHRPTIVIKLGSLYTVSKKNVSVSQNVCTHIVYEP